MGLHPSLTQLINKNSFAISSHYITISSLKDTCPNDKTYNLIALYIKLFVTLPSTLITICRTFPGTTACKHFITMLSSVRIMLKILLK